MNAPDSKSSAGIGWKAVLGFLGVAALLYYFASPGKPSRRDEPLSPAPEIRLPDLSGRSVSLSDFKGKVVLLDFWATWCQPCIEELPELKALHAAFSARGFTVLGVSLDALGAQGVGPFVRENQVPYPVLLTGGTPPSSYPLMGLPTAFLIDRQGRLARRYLGPKTFADLAKDVEKLLGP